ncbi:MAG: Na+/H+ antiporter NhaC family protein, partial [Pirellulales bacterium]
MLNPSDHPYGFWSLVPPLVAITLAIATRRVVVSLFIGLLLGAAILADGSPLATLVILSRDLLWGAIADVAHLQVFAFTLTMGAMVGVMQRSGGMLGLINRMQHVTTNRRRGQVSVWLLGLIVFFDDYANTLLLGGTMRPLTDRLRISREKLAYLVDSTAAPVAGVALVSTWVAMEISLIDDGLRATGAAADDFSPSQVFVDTIVYRFYPLLALAFVGIVAVSQRDFGPMLTAERRTLAAQGAGESAAPELHDDVPALRPENERTRAWYLAVAPIVVTVAAILWVLIETGGGAGAADASIWQRMNEGDPYLAMIAGSVAGLACAALLGYAHGAFPPGDGLRAAAAGAWQMMPAIVILTFAWALAAVTRSTDEAGQGGLQTGAYLAALMGDAVPAALLPLVVFLCSAVVAFCTGSSWATMAILTPLSISLAWQASDGAGAGDVYKPIM